MKPIQLEDMKPNPLIQLALALLPVAMLTLVSCSSTSESSPPVGSAWFTPNTGAAGGVRVQTIKVAGTVTAIDKAKRTATILTTDGIAFTVTVKPKAANFEQINVNDQVTVTVVERIVESLADEGTASDAKVTTKVEPRAQDTTDIRGEVIGIDSVNHTVTVEFDDGHIKTFDALDDYHHQVGQKVEFRVTERVAISIEKQE